MSIKRLPLILFCLSQALLLGCLDVGGKTRLRIEVPVSPGRETEVSYNLPSGPYRFFVFCDRKGGTARDVWQVEYSRSSVDGDLESEQRRSLSADENTIWLEEVESKPGSRAGRVSVRARLEAPPQGSTLSLVIQDSRAFK